MIVLGLTGSIGMGKSTVAAMFGEAGVPVHSADEAVHRLYAGPLAAEIEAAFPGTVAEGRVDRVRLAQQVLGHENKVKRLEAIVHPRVRAEEAAFLGSRREKGEKLVLLDIPLLYETGGEGRVDKVLVVSAPEDVQRARVLARPGMTAEKFEAILARQVPDAEKRARADFVLDTAKGIETTRAEVKALVERLS
ncbi:dephospho-CoA kinase [Aureimonas psammosilenae]|uniref:dephospho-CoA kinase n=1 Tax=Aureimonas psammosilenae TaxID=2495496 RepID=UPI0012608798|nr:dephospho-CoA kinase [Aureimonas psammosilenae]